MAVVPTATTFGVGNCASLSCVNDPYSGASRAGKVPLYVQSFSKGHKCLPSQSSSRSARPRTMMMSMTIPIVPYMPQENNWQLIDVWNALYRERLVLIGSYIDVNISNDTLSTLLYLDSLESTKRLTVYVNGCGGDILSAFALYDTMRNLKAPFSTHCIGIAHDIGAFILASGEKGERTCTILSRTSFQPLVGSAQGQADDVLNETRELVRIRDKLYNELSGFTGQTMEKINKEFARFKSFTPKEAQEFGIVDRIIRPHRLRPPPEKEESE